LPEAVFFCENYRQNEKIKGNILLHYALFLENNRQISKRKLIFFAPLGF
jgi:hypothetical protein